jgi:hypothetical protein
VRAGAASMVEVKISVAWGAAVTITSVDYRSF